MCFHQSVVSVVFFDRPSPRPWAVLNAPWSGRTSVSRQRVTGVTKSTDSSHWEHWLWRTSCGSSRRARSAANSHRTYCHSFFVLIPFSYPSVNRRWTWHDFPCSIGKTHNSRDTFHPLKWFIWFCDCLCVSVSRRYINIYLTCDGAQA